MAQAGRSFPAGDSLDVLEKTFHLKVSDQGDEGRRLEEQTAKLNSLSKEDLVNFILKQHVCPKIMGPVLSACLRRLTRVLQRGGGSQSPHLPASVDDVVNQARYKSVTAASLGLVDLPEPAVNVPGINEGNSSSNMEMDFSLTKTSEKQVMTW